MVPPTKTEPRRIDQHGRIAVPAEVQKALGVEKGDYVVYEIDAEGVRLRRVAWVEQ